MKKAALKEKREVRIYNGRGSNYGKPLLMLQGNWLQEFCCYPFFPTSNYSGCLSQN